MNAGIDTKESSMTTKEIIDCIFKDPGIQYELTEFENLGKPIHNILSIYPKTRELLDQAKSHVEQLIEKAVRA